MQGSTHSWSTAAPGYVSDVSLKAVVLWAWYETAGRVELLKSTDQLWYTGHVLPAAHCAEADTPAVVRRVQLTGSICYWGVMNTVGAMKKWITATLLTHNNSNDCALCTDAMVIIMISLIIMMIRMQMVAAESMMEDNEADVCLPWWWQCVKTRVGEINTGTKFTIMLIMHAWKKIICISALDWRTREKIKKHL